MARRYAATLRGQGCAMRRGGTSGVGENLAWAGGQHLSPGEVVRMWVEEKRHYDAHADRCAPGKQCGHYTQVVWANAGRVGCGMARCDNSEIWVCNYAPPGNVVGRRPIERARRGLAAGIQRAHQQVDALGVPALDGLVVGAQQGAEAAPGNRWRPVVGLTSMRLATMRRST